MSAENCQTNVKNENELVALSSLSELTGFPIEFIKKELLMDGEEVSMKDLRASMIGYLEKNYQLS